MSELDTRAGCRSPAGWLAALQASLMLLAALADSSSLGAEPKALANSSASNRPYWQRPGCHQVGHTRTISIPGCVKFNLSTNACRGYCMSFAIPADEDIGPAPVVSVDQLEGLLSSESAGISGQRAVTRAPPPGAQVLSNNQLDSLVGVRDKKAPAGSQLAAPALTWATLDGPHRAQALMQLVHTLPGGQRSPLSGAIGDTSVKRDVISVGQCCSMMETEEVIVNLRCGLNETRRLVFKSAKTCECFFCKHV